jgi:hypothetical protein
VNDQKIDGISIRITEWNNLKIWMLLGILQIRVVLYPEKSIINWNNCISKFHLIYLTYRALYLNNSIDRSVSCLYLWLRSVACYHCPTWLKSIVPHEINYNALLRNSSIYIKMWSKIKSKKRSQLKIKVKFLLNVFWFYIIFKLKNHKWVYCC